MTPVFQTVVEPKIGNCMQAGIASLFDLDLSQVPNFILYSNVDDNHAMLCNVWDHFFLGIGYEYCGLGYPEQDILIDAPHVNGFISATVPSKTFDTGTHLIIIDRQGICRHDPNPNKRYLNEDVVNSGALISWDLIRKLSV